MRRAKVAVLACAGWTGVMSGAAALPPAPPPPAAPHGTAGVLVAHYHMLPVPQEGPWFSVTYAGEDRIAGAALPARYQGRAHAAGSAIVVVETQDAFSALHRLQTDEVWHSYGGSPLELLLLYPDGHGRTVTLGSDVASGELPQFTVPHGVWQGSRPRSRAANAYWFGGTQLAPAFDYADFEMGYRDVLQRRYPEFAAQIARLTRAGFVHAPAGGSGEAVTATPAGAAVFPATTVPVVAVSPGVSLQEVVGRVARDAHSTSVSVAKFTLAAGRSSGTSFNRLSEEVFLVTAGHGRVRLGERVTAVGPDSIAFIPPTHVHSIEADGAAALTFYAISAPAFSADDYVRVDP